jgi:DNA mismatch endonuclease (patch repair protein)
MSGLVGRISEVRSRTMSAVKGRDTSPELLLRKILTSYGLRYRLHSSSVLGRPDVVFSKNKVAVFCDGDFWHGRNWKDRKARQLKVRRDFWVNKIESNIARDRKVNRWLKKNGWTVIRIWESDLKKEPHRFAELIFWTIKSFN